MVRYQIIGHDMILQVQVERPTPECPKCGNPGDCYGKLEQHWSDFPIRGKRVKLQINHQLYRCKDCRKKYSDHLPHMDTSRRMTERLLRSIEHDSLAMTFSEVARDTVLVEGTIRQIFHAHVKRLEAAYTFATPRVLGIEEVHLRRRARAIFTNIEKATIIEVLKDRSVKSIKAFLKRLDPKAITCITTDIWKAYHKACAQTLPGIPVVVDKFHVVRLANTGLNEASKQIGYQKRQQKVYHPSQSEIYIVVFSEIMIRDYHAGIYYNGGRIFPGGSMNYKQIFKVQKQR